MTNHQQYKLKSNAEMAREKSVGTSGYELVGPTILRTEKDHNIKNLHRITDTETVINHGQKIKVTEIVSGFDTTIFTRLNDYNVGIKSVAVQPTVELPRARLAGIGKLYVIKDMSGSAASTTITVSVYDGETIDGDTTNGITSNFGVKRYYTDGGNWFTW